MRLHQWDVLRANKAPFAFGLEPRVPFLDKEFVRVCMGIDPSEKLVRTVLVHALPCSACTAGSLPPTAIWMRSSGRPFCQP